MLFRRSGPERFDLYTRGSLYAMAGVEPFLALLVLLPEFANVLPPAPVAGMLAFAVVHATACVLLLRASIGHLIAGDPRPDLLRAAAGLVTLAGAVLLRTWWDDVPVITPAGAGPGYLALLGLVVFFVAPLTAGMSVRAGMLTSAVAYGLVLATGIADAADLPNAYPAVIGVTMLTLVSAPVVTATYRVSVWTMGVVWELDRSRQTQAQLAVAEERLRFARDLHDVLGRNLSVVALKSDLAAQLARRGSDDAAVEQMAAVRQIADDSLKEVRAVVRGYRQTNLDAELAGARSVLQAAGVSCRIIGEAAGLPEHLQATLGYVVREGTTNVLRHSKATTCTIAVRRTGRAVTLTMENDGAPTASDNAPTGSGLRGLAERLEALDGMIKGEARQDGQFALTARLPLVGGEAE